MSELTSGKAKGQVRKLINALVNETDALQATPRYRDWLLATANHWRYSPFNGILIWLQRRTAVHVAGQREWERRGRQVQARGRAHLHGDGGLSVEGPLLRRPGARPGPRP